MNNNPIKPLIIFLIAFAGLIYAFAIGYAGYLSLKEQTTIEPLLVTAVTVIGGILSTNLGAVLGVTLTPPSPPPSPTLQRQDADTQVSPKFLGLRPSFQPGSAAQTQNTTDTSQKFQIIACWVYVGSLMVALTFWIIAKT